MGDVIQKCFKKKNEMTKKVDFVEERFSQVNCAQTVFSLYANDLGIDEKIALKISSGFGGGMACAETCGAVTGAYMVIGMKHGHSSTNPDEKANTKMLIQNFNEKFKKIHGSLICKKLTGFDISTPEGSLTAHENDVFQTKCPVFIKTACDILDDEF